MLVLVLSVIASPEGKVYLELSSNVKKWGKSQQGNYDPRPYFYSCWSQQKETCIRSFFSKNMQNSSTGELGRPMRF